MGGILQKMLQKEYQPLLSDDERLLDLEKGEDSRSSSDTYELSENESTHVSIEVLQTLAVWQYWNDARWVTVDTDTSAKLERARRRDTPRGDLTFNCFGAHSARVDFDLMEAHCADTKCYDDSGAPLHQPVKLRRIIKPHY